MLVRYCTTVKMKNIPGFRKSWKYVKWEKCLADIIWEIIKSLKIVLCVINGNVNIKYRKMDGKNN